MSNLLTAAADPRLPPAGSYDVVQRHCVPDVAGARELRIERAQIWLLLLVAFWRRGLRWNLRVDAREGCEPTEETTGEISEPSAQI